MAYWYFDLQDVLTESATEDSTEKIQPEVINHLADINEHFREYLELMILKLHPQNEDGTFGTFKIYEEVVRDLIHDERHYIRDLHMIIKVFREEIMKVVQDKNKLETLFSNITDIYKITVALLGSLKENYELMEIAEEGQMSGIGSCFEALAKTAEFDVYIKYARDINSPANRELLTNLLSKLEANTVLQTGYSIKEDIKCYLPNFLLQPIWHCFMYFNYIKVLCTLTPNMEERETLRQVQDMLRSLQMELTKSVTSLPKKDTRLLMQCRARRQAALKKISKIEKIADGWDQKHIGQCCYGEFIREDTLRKVANNGQGLTYRKVLLFDELLILCKSNTRDNVAMDIVALDEHPTHQREFRLKEKFFIRKVDVIDRKDTEELKNAFEIASREHPNVILIAKSVEDKNNWMADLMMLNTRSMLERTLDSILLEEEKNYPLRLSPAHLYKFAEQDNMENIVLETRENAVPLIKGATLIKLVERLTHHTYADPTSVKIFLITYRNFCSLQALLTLLIERFNIPDPSLFYAKKGPSRCKTTDREDWKRYKMEFCHPVQFRVLNVLRHWVDYHFYDFECDGKLLETLQSFLETVNGISVQKWVNLVLKIIERKRESSKPITLHLKKHFPPIKSYLKIPENNEDYGILTIDPIELARQLTLLEFELYSAVKPSELVGCVWTKEDKYKKSPNLMKMIRHTTNFTRWLEKIIVEAQNFKERVAIVSRAIEIMTALQDLNNFNGVLAIVSAMDSASVFRLKFTFKKLSRELQKALKEARELKNDHFRKYQEKLRFINPPCIPFFGIYLTNIVHIEEGNPDYLLESSDLINFNKWRKVAEIIGEIQLYQNETYYLSVESKIRQYIENICPFDPNMSDENIDTYLYNESLKIEPRKCEALIQFPRKWPEINLTTRYAGMSFVLCSGEISRSSSSLSFDCSKSNSSQISTSCYPEFAITKVARKQITFTKHIGSGTFGKVFQGNVKNLERSGTEISVAIKRPQENASSHEKKEFLKEAKLMNHFRHKHILRLLAVCLDGDSPLLVLELMETGDLLKYLRDCRNLQASDSSALRLQDLLAMCEDVARGCWYLEELRFVHIDLACRNCLVSSKNRENRVIKIGDFGLTRDIYKDDYYQVKEGLFPVRWMAPESLMTGIFTSPSDVWSFGVLMWAITSLGEQPYIAKTDEQMINYVLAGGRLPMILNCPSTLYQLMQHCWSTADDRPNFKFCLKNIIALRKNIEDALLSPVDII